MLSVTIISAYRVAPATSIHPNFPRDIVIQFLYAKEREVVLFLARKIDSLNFHGAKVTVLLDLPQEALQIRKSLKPIMDQLKAHNVRFRWNAASDIMVFKDSTQYKADDQASGNTLLAALNIPLQPS